VAVETARGRTRMRRPLRATHTNPLLLPLSQTPEGNDPGPDYESEHSEDSSVRRLGREIPSSNIHGSEIWNKRAAKGVRVYGQWQSSPVEEEETGDESDDEFDSLDDFIVGDDEDVSYYDDTEEESEESQEERFTKPSSPRKLYRGITPKSMWNKENNTSRLTDSKKFLQLNPHSQETVGLISPSSKCDMEPTGLLIGGRKALEETLQKGDSNGSETTLKL
jgi:hypothetical protein